MKRPVLVTIIGVFAILTGIVQVGIGALLLGVRNDAKVLADNDVTTNQLTAYGAALIGIGVLTVLFAIGLLKGRRLSRDMIGLMELAAIGGGIYAIVALDSARKSSGIGSIVGAVIVLYFLFGTEKAKAFFAKS